MHGVGVAFVLFRTLLSLFVVGCSLLFVGHAFAHGGRRDRLCLSESILNLKMVRAGSFGLRK